ncbi:DUF6268 family outer membrane beta-barrel protein [Ferrimonas pelagia]|uniref:DUF6268 family outer membrane beta-barrel protein n=1 Tax=Ferrimonas pelagia TaxID=1177826 RepID=A0ABP9FAF5_9GAMM
MKYCIGALALIACGVMAQPGKPARTPWALDLHGVQFADGTMAQDGDYGDHHLGARLGYRTRLGPRWMVGANISYDRRAFDFDAETLFGGTLPVWERRDKVGVGLNVIHLLDERWSLIVAPRLQWSATEDASLSKGDSYGVLAGGLYTLNSDLQLGLGLSYLHDIKDTKAFPIILVKWQINEKWKLDNPFEPGFSGGAGLELSYRWNRHYELAWGAAYRSDRFALADGVAETAAPLAFLRWSYFPQTGWDLSVMAGYQFDGELEWDGQKWGRRKQDIDGRLGFGVSFNFMF